jgi:hypothetical protein
MMGSSLGRPWASDGPKLGTSITMMGSSLGLPVAYLDTNAHVVETVWVARTSEWSWLLLTLATI